MPTPNGTAASSQPGAAETPTAEGFNLLDSLRGPGPVMTADEAAKRATKTAPSVARSEALARRAELAAAEVNVLFWPRLDLEARYTLLSEVNPRVIGGGGGNALAGLDPDQREVAAAVLTGITASFSSLSASARQQHTGLFQARVSYPVSSLFFSIIPRYKASQKSAEAAKLQTEVQNQTIGLQAREAFYNYARTRAALMVARSAEAQAEARRRDVVALVNAGSQARVELMRSDADVAAAKVAVSRAEGLVAIARNALYTLMHYAGAEDLTLSENFEEELPPLTETNDALLAKALANRSELKQLRTTLEGLEYTVDAAQGLELPQLSVGGQAEYSNPNQRYFGEAHTWNGSWAAFAALTWSPNDWQTFDKRAGQARADIATALADVETLEDGLRIEVTRAYEDYNTALASLESARSGISAATESYRVRREQFRAGAAVATDVIIAEGDLRNARLALVNAVIDMRIAKARLDRAVEAQ